MKDVVVSPPLYVTYTVAVDQIKIHSVHLNMETAVDKEVDIFMNQMSYYSRVENVRFHDIPELAQKYQISHKSFVDSYGNYIESKISKLAIVEKKKHKFHEIKPGTKIYILTSVSYVSDNKYHGNILCVYSSLVECYKILFAQTQMKMMNYGYDTLQKVYGSESNVFLLTNSTNVNFQIRYQIFEMTVQK